ncbi:MAG: hypothetical protein U0586_11635 [Candidatus Brocadiaceae bacterium]
MSSVLVEAVRIIESPIKATESTFVLSIDNVTTCTFSPNEQGQGSGETLKVRGLGKVFHENTEE